MEKVLTVIPAKRNSRRFPGKNLALLSGKPLVVHAVEQAVDSSVCGEICVGTDDEYIAEISRKAGARVPFLRQNDTDEVTSVGIAALNILMRYEEELRMNFEYLCLLLTTSPLRRPADIKGCLDILKSDPTLDAAMSIVYAEKHPCWAWRFEDGTRIRPLFPAKCHLGRHDLPKPYYIDGAVYWTRTDFFKNVGGNQYRGNVGGYIMPAEYAVDVDTPLDLAFCEFIISMRQKAE